MLRIDYPELNELTLYDILLPEDATLFPPELAKVDSILQDESFEAPFIEKFNKVIGRATVPVRVYIRMMYLKHTNGWGYDTLEKTVNQNTMLKKFCRIPPTRKVPDSTTLVKLNKKYTSAVVEDLNNKLVEILAKKNVIRGKCMRLDTTVVKADIHYPTDAGLLNDCAKAITRVVKKIGGLQNEAIKHFRSKSRTMKGKTLEITKVLRRRTGEKVQEVRAITGEMVSTVNDLIKSAKTVLKKVETNTCKQIDALSTKLKDILVITDSIVDQTQKVLSGEVQIPDRVVSIHDTQARVIKKGKLGVKAEFGYKTQLEECENGIITGYQVYEGNPTDDALIYDAVNHHEKVFHRVPHTISGDRGYYSQYNEDYLKSRGVKNVIIPKRGKKSKARLEYEKSSTFRRYKRWRAGIEGRISCVKRDYGLEKSLMSGKSGTATWVGWGILAHNLDKAVAWV